MGQLRAAPSWRINVDQWNTEYDRMLWVRAAERIDVPAGGVVPGPLDIEPLPPPSARRDPRDGPEFAAGWLAWWQSIVAMRQWDPTRPPPLPPAFALGPPHFGGLAQWDGLRTAVVRRWQEADAWSRTRAEAGYAQLLPMVDLSRLVKESLGRSVGPFTLELIVLPVLDDEIRQVGETRYLVPERVYESPGFVSWLRPLVIRLGTKRLGTGG
jgi:hypothetical protein